MKMINRFDLINSKEVPQKKEVLFRRMLQIREIENKA